MEVVFGGDAFVGGAVEVAVTEPRTGHVVRVVGAVVEVAERAAFVDEHDRGEHDERGDSGGDEHTRACHDAPAICRAGSGVGCTNIRVARSGRGKRPSMPGGSGFGRGSPPPPPPGTLNSMQWYWSAML